ncbi:acetate and butyrate kinase [Boletus edulis]|nr:acetate and butyrate kinase [Boletus edulis]
MADRREATFHSRQRFPDQSTVSIRLLVGSSSLKISLYQRVLEDPKAPRLSLTSTISSISSPPARVSFQQHPNLSQAARHPNPSVPSIRDHESAFIYFLDRLKADVSIDRQQVTHIYYTEPTVISEQSYHHIEALSDLAPLAVRHTRMHPRPCRIALSIAFFDTAFHRDLPRHVSTYAIDQKIAQERGLKKYGFHGLNAFIIDMVADHLHKDKDELNIIALHLGSGASACAIRGGKSIDTSMGLTPLSGLPGATRAGDVDPSLIFHYASEPLSRLKVHVTRAEEILNRQAGWKALTGTTDFGEIIKKADLSAPPSVAIGDPCTLAFHIVLDRILHYVGAYHLSLRGKVDALVFAGGIGERSQDLRSAIGEAVNCLGYSAIDEHVNQGLEHHEGSVVDIGKDDGGNRMLVCRTDEQFEMARECSLGDAFWR